MSIFRLAAFLVFVFFPLLFSSTENVHAQEPLTFSILPYRIEQALRKALSDLKNDNEGRAILSRVREGVTSIVPAHGNDYDSLREFLRQLEGLGIK